MDQYIEVINEIEKLGLRYRMCCHSLLEFLKAFCYYIKNVKKCKYYIYIYGLFVA